MDPVIHALQRALPSGGTLFDIGANIGSVSAALSTLAGKIIAVEPGEVAYSELRANAAPNVIAVKALVGVSGNRRVFLHHTSNSACSTSVAVGSGAPKGHTYLSEEEMAMVSVDDLADKYGPPHVIKIDVEGSELDVLAGADRVLRQHNPIVVMEFNALCLMQFANINPREALERICAQFGSVERIVNETETKPVSDRYAFLHDHIIKNGSVDNLVCRLIT